MDLEVVGRHALLFDDDANAAFVNSKDALVEWNSLFIDRYDVRHFLSAPPPRNHRRQLIEPDLDHERYLDLPSPLDEEEQGVCKDEEAVVDSGYRAVGFSYGNLDGAAEQKISEVESVFVPPFPVPESLIQNLPPSEKVHQIIARTATFVSQHGGQSEIVLRVKQGDNPTFGFLMPDHHLHAYFRYLVDHQELMKSDVDGKQLEEERKGDTRRDQTGGALSLLGSIYGSGEEDGTTEDAPEAHTSRSNETVAGVSGSVSHRPENTEYTVNVLVQSDVSNSKSSLKEKVDVIKRNRSINNNVKSGATPVLKKDGDGLRSICNATSKSQASAGPSMSKVEKPILEPPSDLKRTVDKIVEFILKNGRKFEAILAEQDRPYKRFEFLLPTNLYHPYYLKVLQQTQKSGLACKDCFSEKRGSMGHGMEKKTAKCGDGDAYSAGFGGDDIPYDYDKKEKFRMILGKTKKDVQESPPNVDHPQDGVTIDADVTAAILRAATRGIKNPNLELFPKLSWGGIAEDPTDEAGQSLSSGSLFASQPQSSIQKRDAVGHPSISAPAVKVIAERAALVAASEADSSEAALTKEEKLKAERLKRAKMFAAMIKSGGAPLKPEPLNSSSFEPPGSGVSSSGIDVANPSGKEREGSSVPMDGDALGHVDSSGKKIIVDECNERKLKRSYRSRSKRHEEYESGEEEEEEDDKMDHRQSRKKHQSHRSSRHSEDKHRHRKRHSLSKKIDYRHSRKRDIDEDRHPRHRHKHSSSSDNGEHPSSRRQHKHHISSDDEHQHNRYRHKRGVSSENENECEQRTHHRHKIGSADNEGHHRSKSTKHRSEREPELEEGEICAKSDQSKANESDRVSRETSVDLLKSYQQGSAPSGPSESTDVSDDFRAKIRAMLMATM